MCHQAVSLVAAEIERSGIATVCVSLLEAVTARVGPPRRLVAPFPLGYPFGPPDDPARQRDVLRAALALLPADGPPPLAIRLAG